MNIDVVREAINFPHVKTGDQLVIERVGAYNVTQWMQFITYRPNVVFITSDGITHIIRRKENLDTVKNRNQNRLIKFHYMPMTDTIRGRDILNSILNSYSQVFFSTSKTLAVLLMGISFFDYGAGIGGLLAVGIANLLAWQMGYNRWFLSSGLYGFNALLVGLGVGLFYQPSLQVYVLIIISALTCFFLTIVFQGVLGKYGLPFLSVPFLLTIWIVALSAGNLSALNLSERGIYVYNELYSIGGKFFVDLYDFLEKNIDSVFIRIYFRSLGAIFFQTHLLAGIIIALGLLIYSRITFVLSILGYGVAYLFYWLVGIEFNSLGYTFIGFNYILTAIALGGYYLVPGRVSFGWVILLLPAVVLITTSTQQVFLLFRISPYSSAV
jgi:urea transporter